MSLSRSRHAWKARSVLWMTAVACLFIINYLVTGLVTAGGSAFATEPKDQTGASPSSITIGFIPSEDPATLRENGLEVAKRLQEKLGLEVNIYISKDYTGLIEAMKAKKVDFAFLTAMTFVFAEKSAGAKVLLKRVWKGPFYYSVILADSSIKAKKVSDLKGRRFAFVDKKSTSGFLYPQVHFKKLGIAPERYFSEILYSGNHEASVALLRKGKVDAIAVFSNTPDNTDSAWAQFSKRQKGSQAKGDDKPVVGGVSTLWASEPIPNDPFCVRKDFYESHPKIAHDLMFSLIELDDDPKNGPRFRRLLGDSSLMLATSQQYEPVREMVRELSLKMQ